MRGDPQILDPSPPGAPTSPGKMATVTGLSEAYISRLLSGKQNKTFNQLRGEYKERNLRNAAGPI